MLVKLTCLLVLLYISGISFASPPTEEDKQKVYFALKNEFWEQCKSAISEESLIIFEDDWTADNEEIRMYRFCIAEFYGFIKDRKMNVENFLRFTQEHFPQVQTHEIIGARFLLTSCKKSADEAADKYAVLQEFSKCARREVAANTD